MSKWHRLAAVALVASATIAATTASVWAFTQETLKPNGNYNFNFGPLDDKKLSDSINKSDPNSPGFHFSIEGGRGSDPYGFRNFGSDRDRNPTFPDYYPRPGMGN